MRVWQSQSHVRWHGRDHVVWVPKYRKRAIFGEMRRGVGRIVRELCQRHGVELVEGHALSDHVHVLLGIPPKLSVANTVGERWTPSFGQVFVTAKVESGS